MSNFITFLQVAVLLVFPVRTIYFSLFKGIARNLNGGQSTSGKGRNGAMAYSMPN